MNMITKTASNEFDQKYKTHQHWGKLRRYIYIYIYIYSGILYKKTLNTIIRSCPIAQQVVDQFCCRHGDRSQGRCRVVMGGAPRHEPAWR